MFLLAGFTGILCVIFCAIIFTFALQYSRRRVFKLFWLTHNLWVVYFILMVLHGSGRLVQPPFFYYFVLGPLIWYTLDKLVSISRNKAEITVTDAQLLPSGKPILCSECLSFCVNSLKVLFNDYFNVSVYVRDSRPQLSNRE